MAKATQAEPLALEALARSLGDPVPKVLHGSKSAPGIFAGASAAEKAAAKYCLDHGWLISAGDAAGKGKARKELYRISPAGLQAVLARSDPTDLLRALAENLKRLEEQAARVPDAVEAVSTAVSRQLDALAAEVHQGLAGLQEVKAVLAVTLEKLKPVDLDALTKKLTATQPARGQPAAGDVPWAEDLIRMVAEQRQRNALQRLTLPQVFERLRAQHARLTIGEFHDGLRRLHEEKRIRLGPYTQALATLDEPRNALFLDREVKYYVDLP